MFALGSREYINHLGFLIERCPRCHQVSIFTVYDAKRKLTYFMVPTVSFGSQQVLECSSCGIRFAVPEAEQAEVRARLMTQDQLSARLRQYGQQIPAAAPLTLQQERTYYQVLQVDPLADPDVVEAAFKRLALKHHPDRSKDPAASARMRELIEAHDVLSDPRRRRAYDRYLGIEHPIEALRPDDV